MPPPNVSESKFLHPLSDMANLWATINGLGATVAGFTPPIVLSGNYTLATFTADLTALRNLFAEPNLYLDRSLKGAKQ